MCMEQVAAGAGAVPAVFGALASNRAKNREVNTQAYANIQQMKQDAEAARLRTGIANEYVARQKGFLADNQGAFKEGVAGYAAPTMETSRAGAEADRKGFLDQQIAGIPKVDVAMRESDSPAVASELALKMSEALAASQAGAGRAAKLGSFGDSWTTAGEGAQGSARKIDTTNNFARGDISMLGADQDLQEFQMRKPIYKAGANSKNPAALLTGIGQLVGTLAGAYGGKLNPTVNGWFSGGGGTGGSSNFGFASPTQRA